MAIQYDINKIFEELEQQIRRKDKKHEKVDSTKENNPIESPEDAPQTKEVAPATSKTTEDTHGGDEASKEIEDSPNSAKDGENPDKEEKSNETEDTGEQGTGDGQGKEDKKKLESSKNTGSKGEGSGSGDKQNFGEEKKDSDDQKSSSKGSSSKKDSKEEKSGEKSGEKKSEQEQDDDYFITTDGKNPSKNKPQTTPEDLQQAVEKLFEEKKKKQDDFKSQNRQEYLKKYIYEIIKKIAAQHAGIDKQDGSETYDKKQMLEHMLKHQNYRLLGDKYELRDARYVQFFIDTSGVYGCGSNKILHELMPKVIGMLERQGYECNIAACGNGFYQRDMIEDAYYGTRKKLESYKIGKVSKIACPTPQTAAQMANEAEFSVILADFDGLSSICEMASLCQKDKIPYFLCTEDRYPWDNPTLHDWVNPELCDYNPELVYDVSMDGNPTLEQYEAKQYHDEQGGYEQDDYNQNNYKQDDYEQDIW